MKTKITMIFLLLIGSCSFAQINTIFTFGGINYKITSGTTVAVGLNSSASGAVTIPQTVTNGTVNYQVTSISQRGFSQAHGLTSLSLPNSITSIGSFAFIECISLTSFIIPSGVTSVEENTFYGCTNLTSINIHDDVAFIGSRAFYRCNSLTAVSIPNLIVAIEPLTFGNCTSLTSVTLPNSLVSIGGAAFFGCSALSSINIPVSVSFIGSGAFQYCGSLSSFTVPSGVTRIEESTFQNCTNLTSINIHNAVTFIGSFAFSNCPSLSTITLPTSLSIIEYGAFQYCSSFTGITIPNTVQSIGTNAFIGCTGLTSVTVSWPSPLSVTRDVFANIILPNVLLNVPTGTIALYDAAPVWTEFGSILPLYTAIPDNNFEQALFDKGIDTVLGDNRVLTAAIINIPALDVSNKGITDLTGIEAFAALTDLNCEGNQLNSLNIATVVLLEKLNCNKNQITSLDLRSQTMLRELRCEGNLLTTINITGISSIEQVYCANNLLTSVNFSRQINLRQLYCNNNQLIAINIKNQGPTLNNFNCQNNLLNNMDLRGFYVLADFNSTLNPNLNCISVDDVAYANANYQKDATASFSPNCYAPIVLNYCRGVIAPPLTSPFAAGVTARWYTVEVGGQASLASPTPITSTNGTRVYYVSQVWGGIESARIPIIVNTLGLPGTPGAITGTTAQGALVGTTTAASYSVAAIAHATIYNWTVPAGVNIVSGQGTTTLTVNFNNVPAGAGSIGNLMVVATNAIGCGNRATRNLPLTKALPAAPTAIRMTDAALAIPASGIPTAVTNISNYIGQPTVLTLTATPVVGVTTYEWDLPYGINVLSGALPVTGGASGGNIITVNFEGVTADAMFNYTTPTGVLTHVLRVGVRAINGVGSSTTSNAGLVNPTTLNTSRLLTLTAVLCSAGTIDGGDVTVCAAGTALDANGAAAVFTNSTTLTLNGNSAGSTVQWQKSFNLSNATDATPVWSTVTNTTTANNNMLINGNTLTASNVTSTVWYRARVTNGSCVTFTDPVKIGASPLARAGVVTSLSSVCAGGNITFTAAAYTGSAIAWEVSTTSATAGFSTVPGENGLSFTMTNAPSTTFYVRNVATSGACTMARSAVKTIAVSPMSVGGTITGGGLVCSGANKLLKIAGSTGSIQWMYSTDAINFISVPKGSEVAPTFSTTSISGSSSTYVVNNITGLTYFKAIVKSGVCFSKESNTVKYVVATEAIAGKAEAAASSVCPNDATTIDLVGSKGDITWQKSNNPTAINPTWANIAGAVSATLNTGNLTETAAYRARVTIGSCAPIVTSNVVVVSINCTTGSKQVDSPKEIAEPFSVVAYPNPSNNVFNFKVNGADDETVSILVFDMTGRQVDNKVVNASDIENLALGQNYSSGVYNVIVAQGMNTKTVRLVKR